MKIVYLFFFLFAISSGCKSNIQYKGNKDLIGNWKCKSIEIISESSERAFFSIYKYGFSTLLMNNDSSYFFSMEIISDVILEKEVFGNKYAKTVLKAGYKNYKSGYYLATKSEVILYDANKIIFREYSYYFNEQFLYTEFVDKENRQWTVSWEK